MNEGSPAKDGGFAPVDYTDGRKKGEWKSRYEPAARTAIRLETLYLVVISAVYLLIVFNIIENTSLHSNPITDQGTVSTSDVAAKERLFSCALGAFCAGALGGCCFGIKWMYHSVAKQLWNEDRRIWRLLTPHVSGVVSLFMVLLVASNLIRVFDQEFVTRPIAVIAFSFLVGYFSDKALAKMSEVADTLFGAGKRSGE